MKQEELNSKDTFIILLKMLLNDALEDLEDYNINRKLSDKIREALGKGENPNGKSSCPH